MTQIEQLKAKLAERQAYAASLRALIDQRAQQADELFALRQKVATLREMKDGKVPLPFRFEAESTPLLDVKFACKYVSPDALLYDEFVLLNQTEDLEAFQQMINEIVNRDENVDNVLLQAIDDAAAANGDCPLYYLTDCDRRNTQLLLAGALMTVLFSY
ncbi:hypothetical protein BDR26DRAFT_943109 [Obelidium mucronatum]|nr:hypothetical protein BDR26DRAFT_943109 [Obelidium mucronatum]